ncbi:MAG: hypothetical protein NZT92_16910 [Abditibacteriales bacterium]|nr:hypothetical protein [Abditibacteriales bacterium]MDW8367566.1 hypothetical protein [Abditibacteriales bacterium]
MKRVKLYLITLIALGVGMNCPLRAASLGDAAQSVKDAVRARVNAKTGGGFAKHNYHFIFAINTASFQGDPAAGEVLRGLIQSFLSAEAVSGDEVSFVPFQLQPHWESGSVWRAPYPPHDPKSLFGKLPTTSLREGNYVGGHDDERAVYAVLEKIEREKATGNWILFLVSDKDSSNPPSNDPRYGLFNNEVANRQSLQNALKSLSGDAEPGGYLIQSRVFHRGSMKPLHVRLYLGNDLTAKPLSVPRAARKQTDAQATARIHEAMKLLNDAERLAEQAHLPAQDQERLMQLTQQVERLAGQVKQLAGPDTALSQAADNAVQRAHSATETIRREQEAKKRAEEEAQRAAQRAEFIRNLIKWLLIGLGVILLLVLLNLVRALIGFQPLTLDINGNQRVVTRREALALVGPDTDWAGENRLVLAGAPVGELLAKIVAAPRGRAKFVPQSKSVEWVQEGHGKINAPSVVLERGHIYRFVASNVQGAEVPPFQSKVAVKVIDESEA